MHTKLQSHYHYRVLVHCKSEIFNIPILIYNVLVLYSGNGSGALCTYSLQCLLSITDTLIQHIQYRYSEFLAMLQWYLIPSWVSTLLH